MYLVLGLLFLQNRFHVFHASSVLKSKTKAYGRNDEKKSKI